MNNLSYDRFPFIYNHIFNYLNLSDLINLRLVNKEFKSIIKDIRILNVSFVQSINLNPSTNRYWLKNNLKIKSYYFNVSNFKILSFTQSPFNFNDLKFLKNDNFNCNYFNITLINQFKQLLYLDLWISNYEFEENKKELLLPKLNTLIFRTNVNRLYITFNTPELKNLNISRLGNFHFKSLKFQYPLTIEHLKIENFNNGINKFENLKCLILMNGQGLCSNSLFDLIKLENFKIEDEYDYRKQKFIRNFYKKNLALNNRSINFYYKGILITNQDDLNQIDKFIRIYDDDLSFYIKNYELIDYDIDFKIKIDYLKSINQILNIPSNFFLKFSNIQSLKLIYNSNQIINVENLENFIQNCKTLNSIKINNLSSKQLLNQYFYNNLHNICLYLSEFDITELNLNYQFILNQKYLKKLIINDELIIDKNFDLEKLNYLEELKFLIDKEYYIIKKYNKYKSWYFLEDYYNRIIRRDYLNFDQLKLLCKNLKLHNGFYYI